MVRLFSRSCSCSWWKWSATIVVAISLSLLGCGSSNKLADYDFQGKTLAAEYDFPPYPEILTGPYFPGHPKRPIHAVIRLGSRLIKEVEASELRAKLDTASDRVDVAAEISERVLTRSSRYLRTTITDDPNDTDFLLEIRVRDYGIDAKDWDAAANFFIDAEVTLIDGLSGTEIWRTRVRERDELTPAVFGPTAIRNVVTAHAFSRLSVEEIEKVLDELSDYCADHITDHLRTGLRKVRR